MTRLTLACLLMAGSCAACAFIQHNTAPLACSATTYEDSSAGCSELEDYPDCHRCPSSLSPP